MLSTNAFKLSCLFNLSIWCDSFWKKYNFKIIIPRPGPDLYAILDWMQLLMNMTQDNNWLCNVAYENTVIQFVPKIQDMTAKISLYSIVFVLNLSYDAVYQYHTTKFSTNICIIANVILI